MARRLVVLLALLLPLLACGESGGIEQEVLWDMNSRVGQHSLAIARQGIYNISVEKGLADADSFLWIQSADGAHFWKGRQSITALLEAGQYELLIGGKVPQADPYRMVVARVLNLRNDGVLNAGENVKGLLFLEASIGYTFVLDDFSEVELAIPSYPKSAGFTLELTNDHMSDWVGTVGDNKPVTMKTILPPGAYTVQLKGLKEAQNNYEPGIFDLRFAARKVSYLKSSNAMNAGQLLTGVIENGKPYTIQLNVEHSADYTLGFRSPDFTVCGRLSGANGLRVSNRRKGSNEIGRSRLVSALPAGQYKLIVEPCDKKASGSFMVNVAERK